MPRPSAPTGTASTARRRSSKTRSRHKQKEKRLAALGALSFEVAEGAQERAALANWIIELKSRQLRQLGARDPFGADDVGAFFRHVTDTDAIKLFSLKLDGETIAGVLGVVRGDCFYYVVPVYEFGAHARYSPGNVLLHKVMAWSIGHGLRRFDFTIGDEGYKREWSDVTVPMSFSCMALSLKGWFAALAVAHGVALKKWLKRSPLPRSALSSAARLLRPGHAFGR